MKRLLITIALAALIAATVPLGARELEPTPEIIREYAFDYMRQLSQQKLSDWQIANQLASSIWWSEKLQLVCPSYFYVNRERARFDYLLRMGTWYTFFGVGKTATNLAELEVAKRNQASKREPPCQTIHRVY
jgi:hypothetical protein